MGKKFFFLFNLFLFCFYKYFFTFNSSTTPCGNVNPTARLTATCVLPGIPLLSDSSYNLPGEADPSAVDTVYFNEGDTANIICPNSTTISSVTVKNGVNCKLNSNVQVCSRCAISNVTQSCQFDISGYTCG